MLTVIVVILVISQLISFYLIVLLNTKISKFNDLEIRQDRLIREMEDTIAAYLLEMKEENDRFIEELSTVDVSSSERNEEYKNTNIIKQSTVKQEIPKSEPKPPLESKPIIPKSVATNAYNRQKNQSTKETNKNETKTTSPTEFKNPLEQEVITLHKEGKTIEEIAKITQKGKTEIELLLKFHA